MGSFGVISYTESDEKNSIILKIEILISGDWGTPPNTPQPPKCYIQKAVAGEDVKMSNTQNPCAMPLNAYPSAFLNLSKLVQTCLNLLSVKFLLHRGRFHCIRWDTARAFLSTGFRSGEARRT